VEVSGDCVKKFNKVDWDAKRNWVIGKLMPKRNVSGFVEFSITKCKYCCKKDSKHEGEKLKKWEAELKVGAAVDTGYIPSPWNVPIPGIGSFGISVKLQVEISGSLSFGYDNCYDRAIGGGCVEGTISGFACLGLCGNNEHTNQGGVGDDVSVSVNIEAMIQGSLKFCIKNEGKGFAATLTACAKAQLYVQASVNLWIVKYSAKYVIYDSGDKACGKIIDYQISN